MLNCSTTNQTRYKWNSLKIVGNRPGCFPGLSDLFELNDVELQYHKPDPLQLE